MSRRPANNSAGVSLFPFLAVLVCTMGSLILLLLVTTKRIRAAAIEKARQAVAPVEIPVTEPPPVILASEPEPEDDPTAEWQTQIEQLTAERDQLRGQLSQSKSKLEAAHAAMMRSKVKAASAADRLKDIRTQQEQSAAERERLQAEIESLQSDLTDAEQRLTKAIERQKTATSKFAFLPFDGRTGTTKRPILIECTQEYIRFLPEDVRLTPDMLNGFTSGFNPLLIASRELIHYWKAYERVHSAEADPTKDADSFETDLAALNDKEREPYVLLLVRPNGAVAFHIAKGFLSQLKVPHGYELITDDMEIDSSNPDPEAEKICRAAVRQTLVERVKLLEEVVRQRQLRADQLQLDPTAQTFVPKEVDDPSSGFIRPKSGPRSTGNVSESEPRSASSGRVAGQSGEEPNGKELSGTGLNGSPRAAGPSPLAKQKGSSDPRIAQAGRSRFADEPPEEPLPQPSGRRYENDDSKPFPFTGEPSKPASSKENVAAAPTTKSNGSRPGSRPTNDPRAANNSTSGSANNGNLARMKRRYLMPRSGIGLEKAIPIRIASNRIVVGGEFEIPVDASVRTESLIDRVLIAMDRVQSGWPSAGEGYHWVPTIKYEVVPGGEQVHQRLNSGLFDLGLVSSVEYLETDPDASLKKSSRETSRSRATTGGAR